MGKWKLRIVIILGIAFFLEGLLHNMKRFYVVFSGLTWGNGNLEYIFIHILLNGACWHQKRAIERQMIFPNVLALIKMTAYYIFFFIMKPKVWNVSYALVFLVFSGRGTNSSGNFDSNFETLTLETLSSRQFWAWTFWTTKFKNERNSWLHPFLRFSSPIVGWGKS